MEDNYNQYFKELYAYMANRLGIKNKPKLILVDDKDNADDILGYTGNYQPDTKTIRIFKTNRHIIDLLRSFCHELVHHKQHENGDFKEGINTDPGYAQRDNTLRKAEEEAYLLGNLYLRDWQDSKRMKRDIKK